MAPPSEMFSVLLVLASLGLLVPTAQRVGRLGDPRMGLLDGLQAATAGVQQTVEGVKAAYEDDNYVPEGFARASHILFLADEPEMAAAEEKAVALKARIEDGDISFGEAAFSFSSWLPCECPQVKITKFNQK